MPEKPAAGAPGGETPYEALVAMVYVHPCNCGDGIPEGACARCRAVRVLGFDPSDYGADACTPAIRRAEAAEQERDELLDERWRYVQAVEAAEARVEELEQQLAQSQRSHTPDSCPHCGLEGKPYCWCGEHAPIRDSAAGGQ
jgi:hypothetical protein